MIIDYLQLIEFSEKQQKKNNRSQELGYITRKLKLLAQSFKIPILAISQLNRNIESRNNKEPLLSDLKESGCLKNVDNLNISSRYINTINVKRMNKKCTIVNLQKLCNSKVKPIILKNKKIISNRLNDVASNVSISQEYIFHYEFNRSLLSLTFNHRYLCINKWIQSRESLLSTKIHFYQDIESYLICTSYIKSVIFHKYEKSYDINHNNFFSLLCKNFVLHNSIEQDADIILILYEKDNAENSSDKSDRKVIDLKVSKNRNGRTGYCQLEFIPSLSIFQDKN